MGKLRKEKVQPSGNTEFVYHEMGDPTVEVCRKRWTCKACPKSFSSRFNLERHERVHTKEIKYKCEHCCKGFGHESVYKRHIVSHTGFRPFVCDDCGKRFARKIEVEVHSRTHTGERPFNCPVCSFAVAQRVTLDRHMKTHFKNRDKYKCPVCGKLFLNECNVKRHFIKTHQDTQEGFSTSDDLEDGVLKEEKQFEEEVLLKGEGILGNEGQLEQQGQLKEGLFEGHEEKGQLREEEVMEEEIRLEAKIMLKDERLVHRIETLAKEEEVSVTEVIHTYQSKPPLVSSTKACKMVTSRSHIGKQRVASILKERKNNRLTFPNPPLRIINRNNQGVDDPRVEVCKNRWSCKTCPKSFSSRFNLERHERVHTKEIKYKCEHCCKGFGHETVYKRHLIIHTGFRPFVCGDCGKRFARKTELKVHSRTHSGERPFKCPVCLFSCTQKVSLHKHMKTHLGNRDSFKCPLCGKLFLNQCSMKRHLKSHTDTQLELAMNTNPEEEVLLEEEERLVEDQKLSKEEEVFQEGLVDQELSKEEGGFQEELVEEQELIKEELVFEVETMIEEDRIFRDEGLPKVGETLLEGVCEREKMIEAKGEPDEEAERILELEQLEKEVHGTTKTLLKEEEESVAEVIDTIRAESLLFGFSEVCKMLTSRTVGKQTVASILKERKNSGLTFPKRPLRLNKTKRKYHSYSISEKEQIIKTYEYLETERNHGIEKLSKKKIQHRNDHGMDDVMVEVCKKRWTCKTCPKSFSSRFNLERHERVHTKEIKYKCEHCCKGFGHESVYKRHIVSHTGFRPFVCSDCGKRFATKTELKVHSRTHTGERPFKCPVCSFAVSQRVSLDKHMKTHLGNRERYKCPSCGKCFLNECSVKIHFKKTHYRTARHLTN